MIFVGGKIIRTSFSTIGLLIALDAIDNLVIHEMDVKTTFLNGYLKEEVYMKQLEGFMMSGNEHKVSKLIKISILYCLMVSI